MKVVRELDPSLSEPETFTGERLLERRLDEQRLAGMRVARVTFTDGGRTFWHRHHGEQVLCVLCGKGWVQTDGEKPQSIEQGDIVYVAPGERHWHGAQADETLKHLAITVGETEWEEEVEAPIASVAKGSGAARARKWEHTALAVADLDAAIAFYHEAFAYNVLFRERVTKQIAGLVGLPSVECDLAQLCSPISPHVLELIAFRNVPPGGEEHAPTQPGSGHLPFVVDDLEDALATVKGLGGSQLGEVTCFEDGRRVYCRASGTAIELAELWSSPRSQTG